MYNHIAAQPTAFANVVERNRAPLAKLSENASKARKILLIGIGTSYHAAQIGGHLLRVFAPAVACEVWHSFDFCLYGPQLSNGDLVVAVSHRGAKTYTLRALERATEAGCSTAMITGQAAPPPPMELSVFETVEQEQSSAHTISHVGAVGVLAEWIRQLADHPMLNPDLLDELIPSALSTALATEDQMACWAETHSAARRIWLVGAGPTEITANEIALKIKETSYLQAEAFSIEVLLHGPFQCCEPDDLLVLLMPGEAARPRMLELTSMIKAVGSKCVLITDEQTSATTPTLSNIDGGPG